MPAMELRLEVSISVGCRDTRGTAPYRGLANPHAPYHSVSQHTCPTLARRQAVPEVGYLPLPTPRARAPTPITPLYVDTHAPPPRPSPSWATAPPATRPVARCASAARRCSRATTATRR